MKIIQIIPYFGIGGAEIMCENLVYGLTHCKQEVIVISLFDYRSAITERLEKANVKIKYLHKKKGLDLSMIFKLYKIFKEEKPDVIHTHLNAMQYSVPAAFFSGIRKEIHTVHSIATKEAPKMTRKFYKLFYKLFSVIPVALSEQVKKTIMTEYGLDSNKVPIVYNGIDLNKCIAKKDYDIHEKFKILHIGRFAEAKNHKNLIEGYKSFCQKYPDSELILIGDGEIKKEIEDYVVHNELSDKVSFEGIQKNVFTYLNKADIFTLPSLYEGMPMTLIEAMASALPIVTTPVGGIPDMLDEKSAIFADVSGQSICSAFETFYKSKEMRERCAQNAKEYSEKFSNIEMAKRYIDIYQNI